jgi:hypothetical protein
MTAPLARALMILAVRGLGNDRREWALAMSAEYQVAAAEGRALSFAAGCLLASLRALPWHADGRLAFVRHAAVVGIIVPLACLQIAWAFDVDTGIGALAHFWVIPPTANPFTVQAQLGGVPALLILWLLLTAGHLAFAWLLLEQDRARLIQAGALILAATVTLFLFLAALFLDAGILLPHVAALVAELMLAALSAPPGEKALFRRA